MSVNVDELLAGYPNEGAQVRFFLERFTKGMSRWNFSPTFIGEFVTQGVDRALLSALSMREKDRCGEMSLAQIQSSELYLEKLQRHEGVSEEMKAFVALFELTLDLVFSGQELPCTPLIYLEISKALVLK